MPPVPDFGAFFGPCGWPTRTQIRSQKNRRCQVLAYPGLPQECPAVPGICGLLPALYPEFHAEPLVALTGKDVPFVWQPACAAAFTDLRDALVRAPILTFPTEHGDYILDTAVAPYANPKGNIALQKGRCWQPSLCAYSFVHTCVVLSSPFAQITSLSCGSIVLRTQRV